MTITKNASVQAVVSKTVEINLAAVTSAADLEAMDLPPNAVIQSGSVYTTEAWNSTTSDVLDVGDEASQNRYLNDGNIRALAALVPLVPTGLAHPGGPLKVRWTSGGGTPTTGKVRLTVNYIQLGKASATYQA